MIDPDLGKYGSTEKAIRVAADEARVSSFQSPVFPQRYLLKCTMHLSITLIILALTTLAYARVGPASVRELSMHVPYCSCFHDAN